MLLPNTKQTLFLFLGQRLLDLQREARVQFNEITACLIYSLVARPISTNELRKVGEEIFRDLLLSNTFAGVSNLVNYSNITGTFAFPTFNILKKVCLAFETEVVMRQKEKINNANRGI